MLSVTLSVALVQACPGHAGSTELAEVGERQRPTPHRCMNEQLLYYVELKSTSRRGWPGMIPIVADLPALVTRFFPHFVPGFLNPTNNSALPHPTPPAGIPCRTL